MHLWISFLLHLLHLSSTNEGNGVRTDGQILLFAFDGTRLMCQASIPKFVGSIPGQGSRYLLVIEISSVASFGEVKSHRFQVTNFWHIKEPYKNYQGMALSKNCVAPFSPARPLFDGSLLQVLINKGGSQKPFILGGIFVLILWVGEGGHQERHLFTTSRGLEHSKENKCCTPTAIHDLLL